MRNKNDETLIELIKYGDERAFGTLVKRYLPGALSYADRFVGTSSDEIVQESFIKMWKSVGTFNSEKAKVKTWFYTILTNSCYTYLKKVKRYKYEELDEEKIISTENIEKMLIQKEENKYLQHKIMLLNKMEQQVIILKYFEEKSNQETADLIGKSLKSVESLLRRGRNKLYTMCKGS